MLRIAIIGYGYWGPNLVRNFHALDNATVVAVADSRQERLDAAMKHYPATRITQNPEDLFKDKDIDAVVIATPVATHFPLAKAALTHGKHVLIEKPIAASITETTTLLALAKDQKLALMVDHTFLYTGAVRKMKELIDDGTIGQVKYFDSTRINLGLFQPDINVLWDLAAHDLSILMHLVAEKPYSVNATGISHTHNEIENIAYMTVNYQHDFIAHFNCSWASPLKVRTTLIGGSEKMILYNDIEPSEKIKIYDTGYVHKTDEDKKRILVDYRTGDVHIPKLSTHEALSEVARDFVKMITTQTTPVSSAALGLNVVRLLEAAQHSIKNKGQEIILGPWN